MQSGKTSVMRHLCYLLNVKGETTNLEVDEENVHILSSIPDTDLWMQTRERMRGVMKFLEKNVHHSSRPIWKNKDYQLKMMKKRVLILDESHWGSAEGGRISKILKAGHSSYAYNWHEMKDSNTFVVLVSATPFVEEYECDDIAYKATFTLDTKPPYYGVKRMLELERVQDQCDDEMTELFETSLENGNKSYKTVGRLFKEKLKKIPKQGNGFIIIRENNHEWVDVLKAFIDMGDQNNLVYLDYNGTTFDTLLSDYYKLVNKETAEACEFYAENDDTPDGPVPKTNRMCDIDAILNVEPDRVVVIFIQRTLMAGKTLDTTNVLMVVDCPCTDQRNQSTDTVVQGLVGRCCGYGKEKDNVFIITNKKEVENYEHWVRTGEQIGNKPSQRLRTMKDGTHKVSKHSAYSFTPEDESEDELQKQKKENRKKVAKVTKIEEDDEEGEKPKKIHKKKQTTMEKKAEKAKLKKLLKTVLDEAQKKLFEYRSDDDDDDLISNISKDIFK
jgi:hypothetical protein